MRLLVLALAAIAAVQPAVPDLSSARFKAKLPAWDSRPDPGDADENIYGVTLVGPAASGPRPVLSVDFYSPQNELFRSADAYFDNARAAAAKSGKPGAVEKAKVGGLPARRWTNTYSVPFPPNSLTAERVKMVEDKVVADAGKGFYVLAFSAPEKLFEKHRRAWRDAVSSFQPVR